VFNDNNSYKCDGRSLLMIAEEMKINEYQTPMSLRWDIVGFVPGLGFQRKENIPGLNDFPIHDLVANLKAKDIFVCADASSKKVNFNLGARGFYKNLGSQLPLSHPIQDGNIESYMLELDRISSLELRGYVNLGPQRQLVDKGITIIYSAAGNISDNANPLSSLDRFNSPKDRFERAFPIRDIAAETYHSFLEKYWSEKLEVSKA